MRKIIAGLVVLLICTFHVNSHAEIYSLNTYKIECECGKIFEVDHNDGNEKMVAAYGRWYAACPRCGRLYECYWDMDAIGGGITGHSKTKPFSYNLVKEKEPPFKGRLDGIEWRVRNLSDYIYDVKKDLWLIKMKILEGKEGKELPCKHGFNICNIDHIIRNYEKGKEYRTNENTMYLWPNGRYYRKPPKY